MIGYTKAFLIVSALIGFGMRAVLAQSTALTTNKPQARLQITVEVAPVITTPNHKPERGTNTLEAVTYDLQVKADPPIETREEILTIEDENGHKYPLRRTTVVAK